GWKGLASAGAMAGWPWSARRWLTTAPHDDAAGDQITGRGPLVASSDHPEAKRSAAAPDDLFSTFTVAHPSLRAAGLSLNLRASCVSSSNFSGELATSTEAQPLPPAWPPLFEDEHAARASMEATITSAAARLNGRLPTRRAGRRGGRPTAGP